MKTPRPWLLTAPAIALLAGCGPSQTAPQAPAKTSSGGATAATAEPSQPAEPNGPFLYQLDGKTGPVYLLGTIHMSVSPTTDLDAVVWDSFSACTKVVLELDPTKVSPLAMMARAIDAKQTPLDEQLGAARWTKLTTLVKSVPAAAMKKMKPWLVQMLLSTQGADPTKSMELEFVNYANDHKIEIGALETLEDQLSAIEGATDIDDLKRSIDEAEKNAATLQDLIAAYKEGDLPRFIKIFESDDEMNSDDGSADKLLKDRNEKWVPQIEEMLKSGNIFIAVGAGHLYGEHGVIELLAKRGYKARRLAPTGKAVQAPPANSNTDTKAPGSPGAGIAPASNGVRLRAAAAAIAHRRESPARSGR